MDQWNVGVAVAMAVVGISSIAMLRFRRRRRHELPAKRTNFPPKDLPENNIFTLESLQEWDGVNAKMFLAVCGIVLDVSISENFVPEHGYGKLWAGRDATFALAKMSLDPSHANKLDWTFDDFSILERKSLKSWRAHFMKKYDQVGTLKEYNDRNFSPLDDIQSDDEDVVEQQTCSTEDPQDNISEGEVDSDMVDLSDSVANIRQEAAMADVE